MGIKLRYTAFGAVTRDRPARWVTAVGTVLLAVMSGLGAVLIGASIWIRRTFGPISINQMLMNLPGGGGAETTGAETTYISSFIWQALVLPIGIVLAAAGVLIVLTRTRKPIRNYAVQPKKTKLRLVAGRVSEAVRLRRWAPTTLALATVVVGSMLFSQAVGVSQYVRSATTSLTMSDYYVTPVAAGAEQPRNLITIYLESIEDSFSDNSLFEENMLAPIQKATSGWSQVEELTQFDGGGWTMAGIVGTQCGVPLRGTHAAAAGELQDIGSDRDEFMPGATCLGDVLSEAGYRSVFMGGADSAFASKAHFLRSHGYDEIKDLSTWQELGETEFSSWGLSDRALFEQAKSEVTLLHDGEQPFNLTLLTLDTHEPAHAFDYCPLTTDVPMTSITRCSMDLVAGFIEYLEDQGILEDTAVILMGDHERFISAGSDYQELVTLEKRTIFNRIWSPDGLEPAREQMDQLSMYATILELAGLKLGSPGAGVGVSAFFEGGRSNGILALTPAEYAEVVQSRSADLYKVVWSLVDGEQIDAVYFDPKNPAPASSQDEMPRAGTN